MTADLTDEHIVPLGLNGSLKLPKSSCKACAKITGAEVEGFCLQHTLILLRIRHGLKSRRMRDRPKEVPALTVRKCWAIAHLVNHYPRPAVPKNFLNLVANDTKLWVRREPSNEIVDAVVKRKRGDSVRAKN